MGRKPQSAPPCIKRLYCQNPWGYPESFTQASSHTYAPLERLLPFSLQRDLQHRVASRKAELYPRCWSVKMLTSPRLPRTLVNQHVAGSEGESLKQGGSWGSPEGAEVCQQCCQACHRGIVPSLCQEGAAIRRSYGWKTRGNPEIREHPRRTVGWVELSRENVAANRAALGVRALRQLCC